jgi:autotransporter-associated beta strand protein
VERPRITSRVLRRRAALLLASVCISAGAAQGQDATWIGTSTPVADWNTASNWAPATVPTGTARFTSSQAVSTLVAISSPTSIGTLQFDPGAPAYSLSGVLTVTGAGFTGDSSSAHITFGAVSFVNGSSAGSSQIEQGHYEFHNTSTAGNAVFLTPFVGAPFNPVDIRFFDSSTAGSASFHCQFRPPSGCFGPVVTFFNTSSAGNAVFDRVYSVTFRDNSSAGQAAITTGPNAQGVVFFDASTAGNASIRLGSEQSVNFFDSSSAGSATIFAVVSFRDHTTAGNATLVGPFATFFNSSSAGNATIRFAGFTDHSTAGNATIVGGASFVDYSTAGNATITGSAFFGGNSTGGQARFIINADNRVDFSGTSGPPGDGQVTAGSIEGAGNVVLGATTLTVGGNNLSTTLTGVITDGTGSARGGSLVKAGTGTLTLSGANDYTGTTTVNAGALVVTGAIANSAVTVNAGGTLAGTGTVGATTIMSGGTFAPGNSLGTMTVQGNLAFQSGAIYLVQVTPSTASSANVTGSAALAGTVNASFAPGSYVTRRYTILSSAGGRSGTFDTLSTTNLPAGFTANLGYTANDVILNLIGTLPVARGGLSINQSNVANSLNNFFNSGGALPPGFVSIFGLTGANLGNALTLLSGEPATGAQQAAFQMGNQFLGLMLDPFVDGRGGVAGAGGTGGPALGFAPEQETLPDDIVLAYSKVLKAPAAAAVPSFEQRWSAWGGAYGGGNKTSGDPAGLGSHDLTATTAGFAGGLDYRLTRDTVVGVALAGGGTGWNLSQGLGGGKSDAFQAGLYGATRWGAAYVAGAFAYTNHWMSTDRFAFAADHLTAKFNAQSYGGRIEGGYRFATYYGGITPYAAVQTQSFHTPGYSEIDGSGGGFALAYNARTATDTRSELGARFDRLIALSSYSALAFRGRLAWAHDWVSDPSLAALFQTLPGASFVVNGALPARDSALVSAGTELRLANGVTLLGKFDGEFASRSSTYAGTGTIRYAW